MPAVAEFLRGLAVLSRLVTIDRRGTGSSDPVGDVVPTLEAQMGDVTAVLDAIGSKRAVVFGIMEGGSICALFAATYPHRTLGLILHGSLARGTWAPDYPWGLTEEAWRKDGERVDRTWDTTYPDDIIELVTAVGWRSRCDRRGGRGLPHADRG